MWEIMVHSSNFGTLYLEQTFNTLNIDKNNNFNPKKILLNKKGNDKKPQNTKDILYNFLIFIFYYLKPSTNLFKTISTLNLFL